MEDIICPECGRPNLIEAKKCWYCQTSLVEIHKSEEESLSPDPPEKHLNFPEEHASNSSEESDDNIPDWLKKVRELKQADQPPEEDDPKWQQQDLFESKNIILKEKTPRSQKTAISKNILNNNINEKKNDNPVDAIEEDPHISPTADIKEKQKPIESDQTDDTLSNDLPEGFIKL